MANTNKLNSLDKLLIDIMAHLNPEYFGSKKKNLTDKTLLNFKLLKKYSDLLYRIQAAFQKVLKYPEYFTLFYPESSKIPPEDALEHHIHSYLQDLTILKNKLENFLNILKTDLRSFDPTNKILHENLKDVSKLVSKTFNEVVEKRNPHQHGGSRYLDGDIVDSQIARAFLNPDNPLRDSLTPVQKKIFEDQLTGSFKKAKDFRVQQAEHNNEQLSGLIETLFLGLSEALYPLLKIKHISDSNDFTQQDEAFLPSVEI